MVSLETSIVTSSKAQSRLRKSSELNRASADFVRSYLSHRAHSVVEVRGGCSEKGSNSSLPVKLVTWSSASATVQVNVRTRCRHVTSMLSTSMVIRPSDAVASSNQVRIALRSVVGRNACELIAVVSLPECAVAACVGQRRSCQQRRQRWFRCSLHGEFRTCAVVDKCQVRAHVAGHPPELTADVSVGGHRTRWSAPPKPSPQPVERCTSHCQCHR